MKPEFKEWSAKVGLTYAVLELTNLFSGQHVEVNGLAAIRQR
jgi:hypothetical protein